MSAPGRKQPFLEICFRPKADVEMESAYSTQSTRQLLQVVSADYSQNCS